MRSSVGVGLVLMSLLACSAPSAPVVVDLQAPLGRETTFEVSADNGPILSQPHQGVPRSVGIFPPKGATTLKVKVTIFGVVMPCPVSTVSAEVTVDLKTQIAAVHIPIVIKCSDDVGGTGGQGMGGQGTGGKGVGGQGGHGPATGGATGGLASSQGGHAEGGMGTGGTGTGGTVSNGGANSTGGSSSLDAAVDSAMDTSTGGSTVDCPDDGGMTSDAGYLVANCENYCDQYFLRCNAGESVYSSRPNCVILCIASNAQAGKIAESKENTIGCRIYWLIGNRNVEVCASAAFPSSSVCN